VSDEDARRGVRYLLNGGLSSLGPEEFDKLLAVVLQEELRTGPDRIRTWEHLHSLSLSCMLISRALDEGLKKVPPNFGAPGSAARTSDADLLCPSCKHSINGHMREKHRDWESRYRPHCSAIGCGCGISQQEIEEHHNKWRAQQQADFRRQTTKDHGITYDQDNAD